MEENQNLNEPVQKAQSVQQSMDEFGKLDNSGEVELPEFDPKPFIGKRSKIEFIEERKGQYGFFIKILSEPVDGEGKEIRASRIFGLQVGKNGRIGWSATSKLANFLKKYNVTHYKHLLGNPIVKVMKDEKKKEVYRRISGNAIMEVILQTSEGSDGKDYLTF